MDNENVDAGSTNSGENAATENTETQVEAEQKSDTSAEGAVEQKAGDPCTCPDGRPGTLSANEDGTFTCLANQG